MTESEKNEMPQERIAKVLARAGIASRRAVERLIEDGRVKLHGKILDTPATLVDSLNGIEVDDKPVLPPAETKLWRFHKRVGTLCTYYDPEGRATVFDNLPSHMGRVISVGRLDLNTEGLLLLTNDGELARYLELPDNQMERTYRVRVYGWVDLKKLEALKNGVTIDGIHYGAIHAVMEERVAGEDGKKSGSNKWIKITISEGKNREVRKIMDHLGLEVNRLIRVSYGPFTLSTLPKEASLQVTDKQLRDLLPEFYNQQKGSVAAPVKKDRDTSKWAKAKPKNKVKPGQKRRNKFKAEQRRQSENVVSRGARHFKGHGTAKPTEKKKPE
ncbi:pseudouridine synthase [Temperatibacter marinus]|uniref:Pseudouridine synthase n=1 Tax=Temperatibacter marinus TaxID=1456591 RepID=A0AA52EB02_9PROT|nr:pseudouridine synthase [Temperatibacter marinus]WND01516.1 pseudouridine synthase [Temperatibacter marinus]